MPKTHRAKTFAPALCLVATAACGSSYTIVERSSLQISPNSKTVARTLLPTGDRFPALVDHLALAEEVYEKQLALLRERRNKTRARKRDLSFASYGIMGVTSLGIGGLSIAAATTDSDRTQSLVGAGAMALTGLGLGTILQLTAAMQEETSVADDKVRGLQRAYDSMLERVRGMTHRVPEGPVEAAQLQAQVAATIEAFISEALQINVKG